MVEKRENYDLGRDPNDFDLFAHNKTPDKITTFKTTGEDWSASFLLKNTWTGYESQLLLVSCEPVDTRFLTSVAGSANLVYVADFQTWEGAKALFDLIIRQDRIKMSFLKSKGMSRKEY